MEKVTDYLALGIFLLVFAYVWWLAGRQYFLDLIGNCLRLSGGEKAVVGASMGLLAVKIL